MLDQHSVFESAYGLLMKFLGVDVSAKQVQRISEFYGEQIDPIIQADHIEYIPKLPPTKKQDDVCYVMLDGTMVITRDEGWREMKLTRLFHQGRSVQVQQNSKQITESSIYVSHLGSIKRFLPKIERHINPINSMKVFVVDGAKWIWKWVEDNYPGASQILYQYHAIEKLGAIARHHFKNHTDGK
ncbi:MAG: hypothetical protein EA409_13890 [Saprospirales bacterium]|nr:MAG: hypothetical protein EA409_13890 [Saprospirales bacterium]